MKNYFTGLLIESEQFGNLSIKRINQELEIVQNENIMKTDSNGSKYWYQNGQLHCLDGSVIEHSNGSKLWNQNNQYHRLDGPAVEESNGLKY